MTGHIFIYGPIGTERGEISFDNVLSQINENKAAKDLILHVVSPGGDVFEGEAIYNALKNAGKPITAQIEGTCASIATLVVGAAQKIVMNKTGRFMIHNPKISGLNKAADSRDLRHVANQLDQVKTLLISVYDRKTSLGKEKLWELYDNETWLTADQAVGMGFVDESVDAIKAVAKVNFKNIKMETNLFKNLLSKFQNLLDEFKNGPEIKNEFTETLEDGTVVRVMSEDGAWEGKQVVREDGSPLEPGDYKLATGKTITVGDGSVITSVTEAESPAAKKENEDMDNKIKELEAQLSEAKAAKETAEASAKEAQAETVKAKQETVKIQNRVQTLEKDFLKLKEEATKTFGDKSDPPKGPVIKNANDEPVFDPMGDEFAKNLKARNLI